MNWKTILKKYFFFKYSFVKSNYVLFLLHSIHMEVA